MRKIYVILYRFYLKRIIKRNLIFYKFDIEDMISYLEIFLFYALFFLKFAAYRIVIISRIN